MELLFNEISIISPSTDRYAANEKMKVFSETVAAARLLGFRNIRSHNDSHQIKLAEDYSLYNWLISKDIPEVYRNNLYGMLILPFINEEDDDIEAQYVESNYFFEDIDNGITKTECLGLASAYLYETISISLQSSNAWTKNSLNISVEAKGHYHVERVRKVHSKKCFDIADIIDFTNQLGNINLVESTILPNDKKLHLADQHGKKELKILWNKCFKPTHN